MAKEVQRRCLLGVCMRHELNCFIGFLGKWDSLFFCLYEPNVHFDICCVFHYSKQMLISLTKDTSFWTCPHVFNSTNCAKCVEVGFSYLVYRDLVSWKWDIGNGTSLLIRKVEIAENCLKKESLVNWQIGFSCKRLLAVYFLEKIHYLI